MNRRRYLYMHSGDRYVVDGSQIPVRVPVPVPFREWKRGESCSHRPNCHMRTGRWTWGLGLHPIEITVRALHTTTNFRTFASDRQKNQPLHDSKQPTNLPSCANNTYSTQRAMKTNKKVKAVYGPTVLAHTIRQFFQCGDLKDVSDFVAVSTHRTAVKTRRYEDDGQHGEEKSNEQPDIIPSDSTTTSHSHSSSSSFVIPTRKSMQELVWKNKSPSARSRSSLYCGAFDCANKDTTSTNVDMDDNAAAAAVVENQLDASSIFSRTAAASGGADTTTRGTHGEVTKQEGDQPYYYNDHDEVPPPSRPHRSEYTYRVNRACELRSVGSH